MRHRPGASPDRRGAGERWTGYAPSMARLTVLLSLACALVSCRRPDGPADRYRAFAAAARAGGQTSDPAAQAAAARAVWEMLSERTQGQLEARANALAAEAPPGLVVASARQLVLGDVAVHARKPASIVVVRESADEAVVSVEVEGARPAREVTLVREEGAWRVVVPFDN